MSSQRMLPWRSMPAIFTWPHCKRASVGSRLDSRLPILADQVSHGAKAGSPWRSGAGAPGAGVGLVMSVFPPHRHPFTSTTLGVSPNTGGGLGAGRAEAAPFGAASAQRLQGRRLPTGAASRLELCSVRGSGIGVSTVWISTVR